MSCGGGGDDLAAQLRGALSGLTGTLPRRAVVLPSGELADRAAAGVGGAALPEATAVSLACEALRRAAGEPVYSRATHQLLEQCLAANEPGAWRALLDDEATGDVDRGVAAAFWASPAALHRLVWCMVGAASGVHLWLVVRALQCVLEHTGRVAARDLGQAFHHHFSELVRTLSRRAKDISADMRATVITTLGRLIVWCDIPAPTLAGMLDAAADSAPDDVLRLFVHAPVAALAAHAPPLVDKLVRRAERAPQASRYPACALLAVLPPELLAPHADRLRVLVQRTLDTAAAQGSMDAGLALACGALAKATAAARSLDGALAHALCCLAIGQLSA